MNPKHLIYLATVLDKGSITAAAEHLAITQPTLTRAMATLEMQAGGQLFSRSRYGVKSTSIGDILAREGRTIMRTMDLAIEQLSYFKLGLDTELRIASGALLGLGVMPEIVDRMTREHPHIALTMSCINPNHALDAMRDDKIDVLLGPAPYDRVIEGVHQQLLAEDHIGVFCGVDHPLSRKTTLEVSDLESADWLSLGISNSWERQVLELLVSGGIKQIRTKVGFHNDAAILIRLLSRGRHLAVLPRIPVVALGDFASISELKISLGSKFSRNLYLWARQDIMETPTYQVFVNITQEVFRQVKERSQDQ